MSHLLPAWPSPASARLVPWITDGASLQELLLFPPHPGFFLLGPAQPRLAVVRQGTDGVPKSTWDEPAAHFNVQSIFSVQE